MEAPLIGFIIFLITMGCIVIQIAYLGNTTYLWITPVSLKKTHPLLNLVGRIIVIILAWITAPIWNLIGFLYWCTHKKEEDGEE